MSGERVPAVASETLGSPRREVGMERSETEGTIYRADFLTSKIYHVRFARLNGTALEVYRGEHLQPEHTFQLAGCKLSSVKAVECDVKPQGVNLFKGYVTGQIETKELVRFVLCQQHCTVLPSRTGRFSLDCPDIAHVFDELFPFVRDSCSLQHVLKIKLSKTNSYSKLILGFATPEEASRWFKAINVSLGRQGSIDAAQTVRFDRTLLAVPDTNVSGVLEEQEQSPAEVERKMQPLLPAQAPTNPSSRWKSEVHWDGLAVYREPESNTYATSCTMRASPRCVFQHLVHLADGSSAWSFFQDCQVLGKAPEDADGLVFHAQASNSGGMLSWLGVAQEGHLVPPRDVVVRQSWSFREPSGVFSISYHSVEHPDAPDPSLEGWADYLYHWRSPVRAKVRRMAFTISPLNQSEWNSEGCEPEDSPECMVTLLVQADLGGSLADSSFVRPMLRPLSLVWLASLIRSVVHVRETVEQKRFVEPLFSVLGDEGCSSPDKASEPLWRRAAAVAAASTRMSFSAGTFTSSAAAAVVAAAASAASPEKGSSAGGKLPSGAGSGAVSGGGLGSSAEGEVYSSAAGNGVDDGGLDPQPWLPARFFSSPDASAFNVRSASYLKNKQKQKSAPAAFRLTALEALSTPKAETHISPYLPIVTRSSAPFLMPIHFTLPYGGKPMHLVCVFEADRDPTDEEGEVDDEPFARTLAEFVAGASEADDKRRNTMLKMIPMLKEGSWIMRQTLGSTPVIIGNKIGTSYHRGPNYLEVTVDISSNTTAASITNMVAGAVSSLSIWLAFVLEGKRAEHLPERLLGSVCIDHLDLACATFVDTTQPPAPVPHALRLHRTGRQSTSSSTSTDAPLAHTGLTQRRKPAASSGNIQPSSPASAMLPATQSSGSGDFPTAQGTSAPASNTRRGQDVAEGQTMARGSVGARAGASGGNGAAPLGPAGGPHVTGASSTAVGARVLDGAAPGVAGTARASRSAPFELVEAPQKQALYHDTSGAVRESRLDAHRAVSAYTAHASAGESSDGAGQPHLNALSRNESQDVFHDVCESK